MHYHFGHPTNRGRDHRTGRGKRLDQDDGRSFVERAQSDHVKVGVDAHEVAPPAEETHASAQAEVVDKGFELPATFTVANDQELRRLEAEPYRGELVQRRDAVPGDFIALAVADDDDAVGGQSERALDGQEDARL